MRYLVDMPQRVALVTGGAKRVGRVIVEKLAAADFAVAFTYLSSGDEAGDLARKIKGIAIPADLSDPATAVATIESSLTKFSDRLDVLVNSASIYTPRPLEETDLDFARRMTAVHYESPLLLCQKFAARLRDANGHVINMVDAAVEHPQLHYAAYTASKAALWNLTLSLARELAPQVTVNGIAPGVVEWAKNMSPSDREQYLKRVPLDRPGTPEDVATLVEFLCTKGTYITGQIIRLDGGRSIT